MLPVVICEPDAVARVRWVNVLERLVSREFPSLKMETLPGAEHELTRALDSQQGIMLVILAVNSAVEGGVERCIQLFSQVMAANRDNYVMLCVHNGEYLDRVLSSCLRPAGILLSPLREDLMSASLKRVLNDYEALYDQEDDDAYMVVNSGKTIQRIAYKDILYLEAQDKLLNICMKRRIIRVRESLNTVAQTLPEGFLRCHRSYIVNRAYIDRIGLSEMTVYLKTQEEIPFSRLYKDALRQELQAEDAR